MGVVFEVVSDFRRRSFEPRLHAREHVVPVQLLGRARVAMRDRNVRRCTLFHRQRDADEFGLHIVQTRRFRIQGHDLGRLDPCEPGFQRVVTQHGFVVCGRRLRCLLFERADTPKQVFELEPFVKLL